MFYYFMYNLCFLHFVEAEWTKYIYIKNKIIGHQFLKWICDINMTMTLYFVVWTNSVKYLAPVM